MGPGEQSRPQSSWQSSPWVLHRGGLVCAHMRVSACTFAHRGRCGLNPARTRYLGRMQLGRSPEGEQGGSSLHARPTEPQQWG